MRLHNTEVGVPYFLLSSENLSQWFIETSLIGEPTQDAQGYYTDVIIAGFGRPMLFFLAATTDDFDGNGIPDAWEEKVAGEVIGTLDTYGDPDNDGWVNYQEYQNGTKPRVFDTPPPPRNVQVTSDPTGQHLMITWESGGGPVQSYEVKEDGTAVGTSDANTHSFTYDLEHPLAGTDWGIPKLTVVAHFTGTTSSSAPLPVSKPGFSLEMEVFRSPAGKLYLSASALPSEVSTIRLYSGLGQPSFSLDIPRADIINGGGIAVLPDVAADQTYFWGQPLSNSGGFGERVLLEPDDEVGKKYKSSRLGFVDARRHLKENLVFLLRAATVTRPFCYLSMVQRDGMYTTPAWYSDWRYDHTFPPPEEHYARSPSPASYEYYGFHAFSPNLGYSFMEELSPIRDNVMWRNFALDTVDTHVWNEDYSGQDFVRQAGLFEWLQPWSPIPPHYVYSGTGQSPLPLPLTSQTCGWLFSFDNTSDLKFGELGMTVTADGHVLVSPVQNCYGLPLLSVLDANDVPVTPGHTFGTGFPEPTAFYANFETPSLSIDANDPNRFYFASQTPHFKFDATPPPMPGSDDFTINSTSPLLIASVGEPFTVSGWAKLKINGRNNKFAYLEQYWDKAYKLDASGNRLSQTGQLSPYGEFFPTEPGPTELETMADIDDPTQRGVCKVNVIKLQLDVNHDGNMELSLAGPDNTSKARPFLFWANNDLDTWPYELPGIELPCRRGSEDYRKGYIVSQRNLEDFARLWICGLPPLSGSGYEVTLGWTNVNNGGDPVIKLYRSVETDGGTRHLTDPGVADAQIKGDNGQHYPLFFSGPGKAIAAISASTPFTFPPDFFADGNRKYFLFEGAGVGSGELVLTHKAERADHRPDRGLVGFARRKRLFRAPASV